MLTNDARKKGLPTGRHTQWWSTFIKKSLVCALNMFVCFRELYKWSCYVCLYKMWKTFVRICWTRGKLLAEGRNLFKILIKCNIIHTLFMNSNLDVIVLLCIPYNHSNIYNYRITYIYVYIYVYFQIISNLWNTGTNSIESIGNIGFDL